MMKYSLILTVVILHCVYFASAVRFLKLPKHNIYSNMILFLFCSQIISFYEYGMCSLVVSVLDSPAADPRSNLGSGSALLMSEKSQAVYYISSCHMLIDKALSSDKPSGHWFEADWIHCKRDALSSN